jgi:hypothetical protein
MNTLKIQKEEVTEIKTISLNELIFQLKKNSSSFVPHGKKYYDFVFNEIKRNT